MPRRLLTIGATALLTAALTACSTQPSDPVTGYIRYNDISSFPQPHAISEQVIIVVGPAGTRWCSGAVGDPTQVRPNENGEVVLRLAPPDSRGQYGRGYWPITGVRCLVDTGNAPAHLVQRIIHDIQLPRDRNLRAQYLSRLAAARSAGCPEWEVTTENMRSMMFCGIPSDGYGLIDWAQQPYIVHVGRHSDIDVAAARARWRTLREAVATRCSTEAMQRCQYLDDGTWELFEAADIERTFDARNSDN